MPKRRDNLARLDVLCLIWKVERTVDTETDSPGDRGIEPEREETAVQSLVARARSGGIP